MKTFVLPAIKLTLCMLLLLAIAYPLLIMGIGKFGPGQGQGVRIIRGGKTIGYANVGQKFTLDTYFNTRPSAVNFNAAGSGGSNKGPSNAAYLQDVKLKIDTFLLRNPGIPRNSIPSELVTYSGSGLDPDLSPEGAKIQIRRIARKRHLSEASLLTLVNAHIEKSFLCIGPEKVNVLQLNLALDRMK